MHVCEQETDFFYLWMQCICGLGPCACRALLEQYGSPEQIFPQRQQLRPVGNVTSHMLILLQEGSEPALEKAKRVFDRCQSLGIRLISYENPFYTLHLKGYTDFPLILYAYGNVHENWSTGVGIVGARRCSREGKAEAIRLAQEAAERRIPVISGMAKGIDSYAHTAALRYRGYTIAVLGNGIDICYPPEHAGLMKSIADQGILLSEYPPGTPPGRYSFPRRNRIIAGLSDILYVVDTKEKSGTKTTIEAARKYGKKIVLI